MRIRCNNPECGTFPGGFIFEDRPECPKCGAREAPFYVPLIDIHFVVTGTGKGPIFGHSGRQYVACQPKRDALARHQNDRFAATGDVEQVTCPACMRTEDYRQRAALIEELAQQIVESAPRVTMG